jgi:phage baseplate assembly protein W
MAKKKFLGLQYPLAKSSRGILAQKVGVDQIKADLLQLLLTNPGERVMLPTYGTPLRELIFEPNDNTLLNNARQMISNAILTWEPRIVVTQLEVTNNPPKTSLNVNDTYTESESILYIRIKFVDPENIQEVDELVLERPIGV